MINTDSIRRFIKEQFEDKKEALKSIKVFVQSQKEIIYKAVLFLLLVLFICTSFTEYWVPPFKKHILVYQDVSFNGLGVIIYTLIVIGTVIQFLQWRKHKYVISIYKIAVITAIIIVYFRCRVEVFNVTGDYTGSITALDILALILIVFLFLGIWNLIPSVPCEDEKKESEGNIYLLQDLPITTAEMDLLDCSLEVKKLGVALQTLKLDRSWSIGITSPWGTGKSSFLNLVENEMDKEKFIIIKFNPRNSKGADYIQQDFFAMICSALKLYNSCFSSLFKNYMETLQLFDNKNVIAVLLSLQSLSDRDSEREKLEEALRLLHKKVIVFIEDFDRLFAEEIIEVFKLIDGNAAFPNLIFLSAYDKKYITGVLSKFSDNITSDFSDKFFNLEVALPVRPYDNFFDFMLIDLLNIMKANEKNRAVFESILRKHFSILEKYLPTLRDIKRFLNLFRNDYGLIEKEVDFEDYFLLTIIKYKDSGVHKELYHKKNIDRAYRTYEYKGKIEDKFGDILNNLFPIGIVEEDGNYRKIRKYQSFDIYFFNRVYNKIKLGDMDEVLIGNTDDAKLTIDQWSENPNDFIEYLLGKNLLTFESKEHFIKYINIVFYLTLKWKTFEISVLAQRLILADNCHQFEACYGFASDEYKTLILDILKEGYPDFHYNITTQLLIGHINEEYNQHVIFSREELFAINRRYLFDYTELCPIMNETHMGLLYSCIIDVDQESRNIILDIDSCRKIRKLINDSPDYYIESFVRLGRVPSNPTYNSITCEPFWRQIFGDEQSVTVFINQRELDGLPRISGVRNFWKIYCNNINKPIEIERRGNVQEIVDGDLNVLMPLFQKLEEIEGRFNKIKVNQAIKDKAWLKKNCEMLISEIRDNGFYIAKTGQIQRDIEQYINQHLKPTESIDYNRLIQSE